MKKEVKTILWIRQIFK